MMFDPGAAIARLDALIAAQLASIWDHPRLRALVSAWRSIAFLVDRIEPEANTELCILQCCKEEMCAEALEAHLYTHAYGSSGGQPWGLAICDFDVGRNDDDAALLGVCAQIAAKAHAPMLFGTTLEASRASEEHDPLEALRAREDSDMLALCLPRIDLGDGVMGRANIALAACAARSFARYRWCPNILRAEHGGQVEGVEVEAALDADTCRELAEAGFVALGADCVFEHAPTLRKPHNHGDGEEQQQRTLDDQLGCTLPFVLITTRLAQYLKVVHREDQLAGGPRADTVELVQAWLNRYVADARHVLPPLTPLPLSKTLLEVEEHDREATFRLRVRPHFKYCGAFFTLSVRGVWDERRAHVRLEAPTPRAVAEQRKLVRAHTSLCGAFARDGQTLLIGSESGLLAIVDLETRALRALHQTGVAVDRMASRGTVATLIHRKGARPYGQLCGALRIDYLTGQRLEEVSFSERLGELAWSSDRLIAERLPDNALIAVDLLSGALRVLREGDGRGQVRPIAAALDEEGQLLALSTSYLEVIIFRLATMDRIAVLPPMHCRSLALAPSRSMALATGSQALRLWSLAGKEMARCELPAFGVTFGGDDSLASRSGRQVHLWSHEGRVTHTLCGPQADIRRVEQSSSGEHVLAEVEDGSVHVWRGDGAELMRVVDTPEGEIAVAWLQ